jgi:hypothetical protein
MWSLIEETTKVKHLFNNGSTPPVLSLRLVGYRSPNDKSSSSYIAQQPVVLFAAL